MVMPTTPSLPNLQAGFGPQMLPGFAPNGVPPGTDPATLPHQPQGPPPLGAVPGGGYVPTQLPTMLPGFPPPEPKPPVIGQVQMKPNLPPRPPGLDPVWPPNPYNPAGENNPYYPQQGGQSPYPALGPVIPGLGMGIPRPGDFPPGATAIDQQRGPGGDWESRPMFPPTSGPVPDPQNPFAPPQEAALGALGNALLG